MFQINDRIDIALACGAHGVHLGQSDMPIAEARRLLPPESEWRSTNLEIRKILLGAGAAK